MEGKKKNLALSPYEDPNVLEDLCNWMKSKGWKFDGKLSVDVFSSTGRGIRADTSINSNSLLISLPKHLLITPASVKSTYFGQIIRKNLQLSSQTILAGFLVFENHLKETSEWKFYLKTLPKSFTLPNFCSQKEISLFPYEIREISKTIHKILVSQYKSLLETFKNDCCFHCNHKMTDIFRFSEFKWGYFAVNTRTVYLSLESDRNKNGKFGVEDYLALAPFMDLFNHNFNARIRLEVSKDEMDDHFYKIYTLDPVKKSSQVFFNYGAHDNLTLFSQYGFFIPKNPLDQINISFELIKKHFQVDKTAEMFLINNKLTDKVGFTSNGLNYYAKIVFFILTTNLNSKNWSKKVFSLDISDQEVESINSAALNILNVKKNEYLQVFDHMNKLKHKSESFKVAVGLVFEFIQLLERCCQSLRC